MTLTPPSPPAADPWLPADNGLLAACGPLDAFVSTSSAMIAGTIYLVAVPVRGALASVGHIAWAVQTAGTGASTQTLTGLYTFASPAIRLSTSADISAALTVAAGLPQCAISTPQGLNPGYVYAAIVANFATTQPSLFRSGSVGSVVPQNAGAAFPRFATGGTLQTTLPASVTPSATGAFPWFAGLDV